MRLFGKGHDELRKHPEGVEDMDGRTPAIRKQLLSFTFMEPSNIPIFCASPHSVQRPVLASINHPNLHKLHATSSYSSENTSKNHARLAEKMLATSTTLGKSKHMTAMTTSQDFSIFNSENRIHLGTPTMTSMQQHSFYQSVINSTWSHDMVKMSHEASMIASECVIIIVWKGARRVVSRDLLYLRKTWRSLDFTIPKRSTKNCQFRTFCFFTFSKFCCIQAYSFSAKALSLLQTLPGRHAIVGRHLRKGNVSKEMNWIDIYRYQSLYSTPFCPHLNPWFWILVTFFSVFQHTAESVSKSWPLNHRAISIKSFNCWVGTGSPPKNQRPSCGKMLTNINYPPISDWPYKWEVLGLPNPYIVITPKHIP